MAAAQTKKQSPRKKHRFMLPLLLFTTVILAVIGCYAYPTLIPDAKILGSRLFSAVGQFFTVIPQSYHAANDGETAAGTVKAYAGGGGVGGQLLPQKPLAGERRISQLRQGSKNISNSYFNQSAFVGDSRTEGFLLYNGLIHAGNYGIKSLTVDGFFQKEVIPDESGKKITVAEALKTKDYDTFYIMFGMNELGWASEDTFISKYGQVIDTIRISHPNSRIVIQSILPVSAEKSASDPIHNNPKILHYNELIEKMCAEKSVDYFNVSTRFTNEDGALYDDASTDGIHLNKKYCQMWLEYLKEQVAMNQ